MPDLKTVPAERHPRDPLRRMWRYRGAVVTVAVLALMVAFALACIFRYARDIPLAEDWHMVAPLTGNEPDFFGWLWAQNNEHRVPLPRLIYLVVLWLTGGDFRAGMVFNVLALGMVSMLLMITARRLRGGRSHVADAFFPLLLLHVGHWPNLVWSWQIQFVTAVGITLTLLLILVRPRPLSSKMAYVAGVCLVLLPLCGANGIIYVVSLAPWFIYDGVVSVRSDNVSSHDRRAGRALIGMAVTAVMLVLLYFVGYQRAEWNPPPPSLGKAVETAAAYVAMGFGPAAQMKWRVAMVGAGLLLLPTIFLLARAILRNTGAEQRRALGLTCFAIGSALLAMAIGWGRAGLRADIGLPARYALLSAPTLAATYFVWLLYGSERGKNAVLLGLAVVMLALVPLNTRIGFWWRDWYVGEMQAVERDIEAGVPAADLAERHRDFLLHWDQDKLEASIRMLQNAGIGPFSEIEETTGTAVEE